jgi:hypothetical protein
MNIQLIFRVRQKCLEVLVDFYKFRFPGPTWALTVLQFVMAAYKSGDGVKMMGIWFIWRWLDDQDVMLMRIWGGFAGLVITFKLWARLLSENALNKVVALSMFWRFVLTHSSRRNDYIMIPADTYITSRRGILRSILEPSFICDAVIHKQTP